MILRWSHNYYDKVFRFGWWLVFGRVFNTSKQNWINFWWSRGNRINMEKKNKIKQRKTNKTTSALTFTAILFLRFSHILSLIIGCFFVFLFFFFLIQWLLVVVVVFTKESYSVQDCPKLLPELSSPIWGSFNVSKEQSSLARRLQRIWRVFAGFNGSGMGALLRGQKGWHGNRTGLHPKPWGTD